MLTSKQRAILRAQANDMTPVFQIGKGEIDDALVKTTADCLAARELIKLKVLENSTYSAKEAAELLAEKTGSECVQVIGSKFVLYLQKPKKKESKYADLLK
ncbi:MAG: YhbY family RNA-binding protein [Ruthenibacterium sp.]